MELKKPIFTLFFFLVIYLAGTNSFVTSREIDNHTCFENQFQCETGACVSKTSRCDGRVNCPDLSDEANCNHTDTVLNLEEFYCGVSECGDGTCLPDSKICDGIVDCNDDEEHCSWIEEKRKCHSDKNFKCSNGLGGCIPLQYVCDGDNDCGDLSDEQNCNDTNVDLISEYAEEGRCSNYIQAYLCDDKTCIPKYKVCDGISDCDSDETFCFEGKQCHPVKNFKCDNGECINHDSVCDGVNNCGDLSDEINCCEFTCASTGTCIPKYLHCDGFIDCGDLSDEMSCHIGHPNGNRRR